MDFASPSPEGEECWGSMYGWGKGKPPGAEKSVGSAEGRKWGVQKMVHYIVTKSEAAGRTQFGITAVCGQTGLDSIDDIAPTFEETARLAALLSENGVAAEHFRDVVEDYLAR